MKKLLTALLSALLLCTLVVTTLPTQAAAATQTATTSAATTKQLATPTLKSVVGANGGVTVTWGKVSGAAKYRVFRKTGSGNWQRLTDTTALAYTDKTAKAGTKYTYTVRCITSDGKSYTSSYNKTGLTIAYTAAPKLTKAEANNSGITVTWNKVAGAAKYRVFRKTAGGKWQKLADTTALTYTDKTAKVGTQYIYTVRCVTKDGKAYTGGYMTAGIKATRLATPALTKTESNNNGITITWNKVSGAAKYRVFRKTENGSWQRLTNTTNLTYTDNTAKVGTQYIYTVRCITADGTVYTSGYDATGIKTTLLTTPKLTGISSDTNSITVTWNKVAGAAKYRVYRKTAGKSWQKLSETTALTYTDKTAKSGIKYTYTVRCITADGKIFTSGYDTTGKSTQTHTHTWDSGKVTTAATCDKDGVKTYTCTGCGATKTEKIAKLGHDWKSDGTKTITVTDKAAYDEKVTVVDKEAYDEKVTIVDKEAYNEKVTVTDKEAWNETVTHEGFRCRDCGHEEWDTGAADRMINHIAKNHNNDDDWGTYTGIYSTETIHHDAVTHTETIHHDAVTHTETVHHDAVTHTETVHHDAVTHTETVSNGYTCTRCGKHKD